MTLDSPARLLDRFHDVLVSEIRERRPEYLSDSFTVAEIYQHLVPYSSHRDRLGVEMNGDYEDVLLRLLAGQGDFLTLESEPARSRLREELDSPNPDTSLFREYAAASVRLNQERVATEEVEALPAEPGGADDEEVPEEADDAGETADEVEELADVVAAVSEEPPPDEEHAGEEVASPVEGHPEPSPEHPAAAPAGAAAEPSGGAEPAERDDGTCAWCREELPRREDLNFCPFCGTDARLVPCPNCGEALEPRWRFCVVCGQEVAGA